MSTVNVLQEELFELGGKFVADGELLAWRKEAQGENALRPSPQLKYLNPAADTFHPDSHPFIWDIVNSIVERQHRPTVIWKSGTGGAKGYFFKFGDKAEVSFLRLGEELMDGGKERAHELLVRELKGTDIL